MGKLAQRLGSAYFAGSIAALVTLGVLWLIARADLLQMVGVRIAPRLEWSWLAPRIVWGGVWALGFPLLPVRRMSPVRKGVIWSLVPAAATLLWLFPRAGYGSLGRGLGDATPLVVVLGYVLWGWVLARAWMVMTPPKRKPEKGEE